MFYAYALLGNKQRWSVWWMMGNHLVPTKGARACQTALARMRHVHMCCAPEGGPDGDARV